MIVTCDGCQTKYMLGDEKVPSNGIRVRCPKCRFVWRLVPPPVTIDPAFEVSSSDFAETGPVADAATGGWNAQQEGQPAAVMTQMESAAVEERIEISGNEPAAETAPQDKTAETESPEMRKTRDRAKRLARVFVSDILEYNRSKRDQALANGNLMTVLGPDIKKAWEAYKEKIGSQVSESSEYFRTALNDILADGQNMF
jgi:predicted Zn finger-like uncharacterized protein